jgi:hypothetical protein
MSTALASRPSTVTVDGFPRSPSASTGIVATLPVCPDTTCTAPSTPTATAATPPTVASGLLVVVRPARSRTPSSGSKREAHTFPVFGSTIATVPPRMSTVAGSNTRSSVPVPAAGAAVELVEACAVRASIGTS